MSDGKIHQMQRGNGDVPVSNGYYVVRPDGAVSLIPQSARLKDGWRLATAADLMRGALSDETDAKSVTFSGVAGESPSVTIEYDGGSVAQFDLSDSVDASAPSDPEPDAA